MLSRCRELWGVTEEQQAERIWRCLTAQSLGLLDQVMVLDEFDIHPAKEAEVNMVDWDRTYFLADYYML